jgi:hypothetical protein
MPREHKKDESRSGRTGWISPAAMSDLDRSGPIVDHARLASMRCHILTAMFTAEELEGALGTGYEGRAFELKGHGRSDDKRFLAKVARAALSMRNLRDGGNIVIGIDDAAPQEMLPGLDEDELTSWLAYDDVSARLAGYCDPPVHFDVAPNRMGFSRPLIARVPSLSREVEISREHLVAEGRVAAAEMAREFFLRFGWKPPLDQLLDHQRELTERGG